MIHLSQAAITEINRIKSRQHHPDALFQVGVQVGGCSDFFYVLALVECPGAEDMVLERGEVKLAIAPQTVPYLNGLTIDYSEDLMGGGFRFHNPNAAQTCGCGNSFSIAEKQLV
ncbi:iron-sulfur cluster assembly accessory protein [Oculatella sp. LEGE 06141]|uniref:HesB/IscA family protein n=1 Tax=Oculatella sp. LEGE 06141 TaxID=1828648 RepID=UPI0018829A8B|nr:iron-sulfur cluster assembly accessory protein [Oculatella sp. LEGE 06141]MBE9177375.1 iron-sulfur cluster assembly accessory protein [Oculatella sp. LEGE 06141]